MINYLFKYILIGTIFNLLYDLLISTLLSDKEELRFSMAERLIMLITWPFGIIAITFSTIKSIWNAKK